MRISLAQWLRGCLLRLGSLDACHLGGPRAESAFLCSPTPLQLVLWPCVWVPIRAPSAVLELKNKGPGFRNSTLPGLAVREQGWLPCPFPPPAAGYHREEVAASEEERQPWVASVPFLLLPQTSLSGKSPKKLSGYCLIHPSPLGISGVCWVDAPEYKLWLPEGAAEEGRTSGLPSSLQYRSPPPQCLQGWPPSSLRRSQCSVLQGASERPAFLVLGSALLPSSVGAAEMALAVGLGGHTWSGLWIWLSVTMLRSGSLLFLKSAPCTVLSRAFPMVSSSFSVTTFPVVCTLEKVADLQMP